MLLYAYNYSAVCVYYAAVYICWYSAAAVCSYSAAAVCLFFMLLYASCMLMYARILLSSAVCLYYAALCLDYAAVCLLVWFMHVLCFVTLTDILSTPFGECDTHKGMAEFVFCQHTPRPSACVGCRVHGAHAFARG